MGTILDVELDHSFNESLGAAADVAAIEAANTGATVLAVDAIEVSPLRVTFVGTTARSAVSAISSDARSIKRVRSFHTTWGAILKPNGTLGFLVVSNPIAAVLHEMEESSRCRVAVSLARTCESFPSTTLGPVCCIRCRLPIPSERLKAIPQVHTCLDCQQMKEDGK